MSVKPSEEERGQKAVSTFSRRSLDHYDRTARGGVGDRQKPESARDFLQLRSGRTQSHLLLWGRDARPRQPLSGIEQIV